MLDIEGLQVYAFSLWKLGKNDQALSAVRTLASGISTMESTRTAASIDFICRLLCSISGLDSAINSITKMPTNFFQSSKLSFVVAAVHALDQGDRLEAIVLSSRSCLQSHEEITRMHSLIALSKLVGFNSSCRNLSLLNFLLLCNVLTQLLRYNPFWLNRSNIEQITALDSSME